MALVILSVGILALAAMSAFVARQWSVTRGDGGLAERGQRQMEELLGLAARGVDGTGRRTDGVYEVVWGSGAPGGEDGSEADAGLRALRVSVTYRWGDLTRGDTLITRWGPVP